MKHSRKSKGFALVVTLSLMILLTVVAVGLLSLSAVSLRTSSQGLAQAEARANARLALTIAIGELQKQLGPDQRVSASGAVTDILNPDGTVKEAARNPHWTGAWDSWKAGPGEASQHSTISGVSGEMAPKYQPNRKDYFRSWLLSLDPGEASEIETAGNLALTGTKMPSANATAVQLVADGSLGKTASTADFVSVRLLKVDSSANGSPFSGRYGWWVGDESQKARLMDDSYITNKDATLAARLSRQQAPGSMGTRTIKGLENITNEQQLAGLPSLLTAGLVDGATKDAALNFHSITPFSYQVLADVREGGLKRDLSALLERPVNVSESGDGFMLYKFNDKERVPIQDLAAYYQLYRESAGDANEGNKGVQYSSALLGNGIQVATPDYGGANAKTKFHRQYTSLYRSPVPIKLQLLLGMVARPRAVKDITTEYPDTHEMFLTTTLSITLWNPTNLPMVMDNSGRLFQRIRWLALPLQLQWTKNGGEFQRLMHLGWLLSAANNNMCELDISRGAPLRFEPGEVKVLSIPYQAEVVDFQRWDNESRSYQNLLPNWDPYGFLTLQRSARAGSGNKERPHIMNHRLLFSEDDLIQLKITSDYGIGAPIDFRLGQDSYQDLTGSNYSLQFRYFQYTQSSRVNPGNSAEAVDFNQSLMARGFPGGSPVLEFPARTGSAIVASSQSGEPYPFMQVSLMAGTESYEGPTGGAIGGRKFASRPFLHSSAISPNTIDSNTPDAFYNYGWNWWIEPINSVLEAPVQVAEDGKGYYGGGYTPEAGTTHVVQQELPVVPPMSIASLSHAHLGGYSLAISEPPATTTSALEPEPLATGMGGLFPHTLQAIGNSYAHPHVPAGEAHAKWERTFVAADGAKDVVLADHSYLANKALWDEFFFSSITPQPASVQAFGGTNRDAKQVAADFFFNNKTLPNRRITPYTRDFNQDNLNELFKEADVFGNGHEGKFGLADKIAARLMVEGPFNINSTTVPAWKALLSSLKGKPVAYLDKDKALAGVTNPDTATTTGTPVSGFTMPNAKPGTGSDNPRDSGQWLGWRELKDTEIDELAGAIVRQVKLRGPFLSLSEFVNRRLDSSNVKLSTKGALQAALDDPAVSINAGFRNSMREFSDAEKSTMSPVFSEALDGPVAYGSAAYVDQADLLRNFAAQLTPRGDTFVIRTYGDALDPSGKVVARAWCEAVVQRVPEYFDPVDEPSVKQANLKSNANKVFGRKLEIVTFRWLASSEI